MSLAFDDERIASLDGAWDFYPGDHKLTELDGLAAETIDVPGLWEAQGHLDLDGTAWYRRRFNLDDVRGHWTLRFGAVMDTAEVFLNGSLLGAHDQAYTPFEVDPQPVLRSGDNDLAVRVFDPPLNDPEHLRSAHGKQGWANHVFPSRPSLYMTYGGIWQPVTLRRHGAVVVTDVFVQSDPDDLVITTTIENRGPAVTAALIVRTVGMAEERQVELAIGARTTLTFGFGATNATRWRPGAPALHHVVVDAWCDDDLSDSKTVRYGLRTVGIEQGKLAVDGVPVRMRSVLVQGFRADGLYAEGTVDQIRQEVAAAQAMGFNVLRLHIKAFDPTYLDVCDEMGMLLHCDIPVAEPILHEEMGFDTTLTRRCVDAARQQVRRDRNHPSVVLWSAMNEICEGRHEARQWPGYESLARALFLAVEDEDPTRPIIENDWVEPDPDRVFLSPILTAHWYGQLHRDYLDKIDTASASWRDEPRPLFVTEFGDWGLPEMPALAEPPFWDTRAVYAAGLASTQWPATVGRFALETQRYQGLSDRLQAEVFRRHDHIGGYCLTELTDVPHELNGLLDLNREPKTLAVAEIARANQVVLPILELDSLVALAGEAVRAPVHVANDGEPLADVVVEARFGDSVGALSPQELLALDTSALPAAVVERRFRETTGQIHLGDIAGYSASHHGDIEVVAPDVTGSHDLVVRLRSEGRLVSENRYPVHVLRRPREPVSVQFLGPAEERDGLVAVGAVIGDAGPTVVAEGALDAPTGEEVQRRLLQGEVVVVLAQGPDAGAHYPVTTVVEPLTTAWGSTVFRFTTDHGGLPCLPRRALLVAEDSTVQALNVVARVGESPFPDTPVVIAYKPMPGALTGTVVGSHAAGAGRMVFCQYRLSHRASSGDAVARAVLSDLLRWAAEIRPALRKDPHLRDDGRRVTAYSWPGRVAR